MWPFYLFGVSKHEIPEAFRDFFKNVLGFRPRNIQLYLTAFTHRSQTHAIQGGHKINNERLEYLGDAVLSSVIADYLYHRFPFRDEGFLTETRSRIVSRASLGQVAHKIGLSELVSYNHNGQGVFKSMAGDAFEALIGAIYLERGYKFTYRVIVNRILIPHIDVDALVQTDWNYKSKILDWGQKNHHQITFKAEKVNSHSPKARKQYRCWVCIDNEPAESAIEYTIKAAEQLASEKTYKKLMAEESVSSEAKANLCNVVVVDDADSPCECDEAKCVAAQELANDSNCQESVAVEKSESDDEMNPSESACTGESVGSEAAVVSDEHLANNAMTLQSDDMLDTERVSTESPSEVSSIQFEASVTEASMVSADNVTDADSFAEGGIQDMSVNTDKCEMVEGSEHMSNGIEASTTAPKERKGDMPTDDSNWATSNCEVMNSEEISE